MDSGLLDRHIAFVEALRSAGLPVSLAEDLDAVRALGHLSLLDRESLRASYAATLVKRSTHRTAFDTVFDLFFPALLGEGIVRHGKHRIRPRNGAERDGTIRPDRRTRRPRGLPGAADGGAGGRRPGGAGAAGAGRDRAVRADAGTGAGAVVVVGVHDAHRVDAQALVDQVVAGLLRGNPDPDADEPAVRRRVQRRVDTFGRLAEADARRRIAEDKGPEHMARHAVRPPIEDLDFLSARRSDLEEMRRQIHPLARRLATRLTREHHARRRGPLDFRRTVRASISTGGVPMETRHKPKRPGRTDLVVLCDVSGSVANFAQFTLMLVFALREQFSGVRAFTFVDDVHEVTDHFRPGADPVDTMLALAQSAQHATLWGRTNYGRAFQRFSQQYGDALNPRSSLLVLGDARSNHSDLALSTLRRMAYDARHAWWLNPEHVRHWDTGDSAAGPYGELVRMVECRNLTQLGEFVHDLAG